MISFLSFNDTQSLKQFTHETSAPDIEALSLTSIMAEPEGFYC